MAFDAPINANDASFERAVLGANLPAVAVFWSPETAPRHQLNETLEAAARRYAGEAVFVKLDVADAPEAARRFQVAETPQFLFFRQGQLVARARGLPDAHMLAPWVEYLLGRGPRPAPRAQRPQAAANAGAEAAPAHPLAVSDADFERAVLQANGLVLVDFWAPWCGPCRMVAPVLDQLAAEFAGRVLIAKLNVDENPRTAGRYSVQSIPTLLFFRGGREIDRTVGAPPADALRQKIQSLS